ncbi:hypothetical protein [Tsukamurella spumae]|uniref:Mce-associated membrane protein n=1 Tax=Tsukamurella spumae TaxID=44753 RepID=A0A846X0Z7_9ACTN|nr:hypothetical protein [Tsukamurella spumae]NKY17630.1 hypothetical protein [Tsukamurella spumae]
MANKAIDHEDTAAETSGEGADEDADTATEVDAADEPERPASGRRRSIVLTIVVTVLTVAVIALSVTAYLQHRASDQDHRRAADRAHAEQLGTNYAVKAATLNYNDLTPWLNAMKTGVTPTLAAKYDAIAEQMRQVLVPLRMVATATPVVAKVSSEVGGVYQVKVVVDVSAQSAQSPQGTLSTTAYTITLDRDQNWVITEVGDPASGPAVGAATTSAAPSNSTPAPTGSAQPTIPAIGAPTATPSP